MEGTLWKWTNYWNGWQTRWFILENGILSYYKSHDEVSQGCKGSVKVTACQINVNTLDATRLDVVIPGEQHMYLRAPTAQERQQWLVALGSAKACLDGTANEQKATDKNSLMHKKYELRLCCDLMMQQVHALKNLPISAEGVYEIKEMDEATSLLSATCDTFIRTLEDCMKLSNAQTNNPGPFDLPLPSSNAVSQPVPGKMQQSHSMISQKVSRQNISRSLSQEDKYIVTK